MYDAYIEKEDLFGKTGEMKVIYTPRVSSAGNIGLRQYAMRGVGIRHRCRGFPACGYEEGVRLLGFVFVKNQAGQ